jgi:Zn-dependent protease with chaperone function
MTYFLRGAFLWLGTFFLIYLTLSLGLAGAWQFLSKRGATWNASCLYALRAFPLVAAMILVFFFAIPSFLRLEPYGANETIGYLGLGLAFGGTAVVAFGAISALLALWNTSRFLAAYPQKRLRHSYKSGAWVVEIVTAKPMLLVAGIYRPKVLVSQEAVRLLDEAEMRAGIRHEQAHARFHDNLKKLVLRAAQFPLLSALEQSWMHAAELAADDAAATDESSALDLASALLKVANRSSASHMPELATSLLPDTQDALRVRVERLMAWQPRPASAPRTRLLAPCLLAALGLLAIGYVPLLRLIHELSELLTR